MGTGRGGPHSTASGAACPAVVGVVAFALYALLGCRDYTAVDGAVHSLEVLRRHGFFLDGNNHILYPVYVRVWSQLLHAVGVPMGDPASLIGAAQLLDAAAAAVVVGAVVWLARRATGSAGAALGAALALGCSHAFLLHATHGAEPLVGLAWSVLGAVAVVRGVERDARRPLALGGALTALAVASYQSMVAVAPGLAANAWLGGPAHRRGRRVTVFAGAAAVAAVALYGALYARTGTAGVPAMAERFLRLGGHSGVFGGLVVGKVANLPLGLASAVAPVLPPGYAGLRALFDGRVGAAWAIGAVAAMAVAAASGVLLVAGARVRRLDRGRRLPRLRARAARLLGVPVRQAVVAALGAAEPRGHGPDAS